MSRTRATGVLLFLAVPLVLVLLLRMPLGLPASVLAGIAIMATHGLVARPFMERHLAERCFWCGRDLPAGGLPAPFRSRSRTIAARACGLEHAERTAAFARIAAAGRAVAIVLIAIPVAVYVLNAVLAIGGREFLPLDAARLIFKVPVAAAVVTASFAWPLGARLDREPAIDVPPHNLSLLGIGWTLWVFRIVGLYWLGDAVWRAISRA
jgi:hypothetical protein